jgi:zinc protease
MSPSTREVPIQSLPFERFELSCGAILLVTPRAGAPVAAVDIHLRGGPSLDKPGLEGTSFLVGSLAGEGTKRHDETELATLLEPAGGEISGDSSGLSGSIKGADWRLLLELMSEVLVTPSFPVAQVRRQKQRMLQRLQVESADPRRQGAKRFRSMIYGEHWLGRPAYGSLESVTRIEPRHLRAYHKRNWVACRGVIAVCGDVEPREVRDFLERQLKSWERGRPLVRTQLAIPEPKARVEVISAKRKQVHVYLGHLGIRRSDPDYATLVVLDHVLGQGPGFTNRVGRILRDELGLAYTVSAGITPSAGLLPGTFTAYIATSPEQVTRAVRGFLHEMRRLQEELVPEAELEVAKSYLLGSFAMGFERASRRAGYLISAEVHQHPADHLEQLPREFAAVTPEDLQRVARRHLLPDRCSLCAAGPIKARELRAELGLS